MDLIDTVQQELDNRIKLLVRRISDTHIATNIFQREMRHALPLDIDVRSMCGMSDDLTYMWMYFPYDPALIGEHERKFTDLGWAEDFRDQLDDRQQVVVVYTRSFEFDGSTVGVMIECTYSAHTSGSVCKLIPIGEETVTSTKIKYKVVCESGEE